MGTEPADWMPLHKALRYLVYDSRWAEGEAAPTDKADFDSRVSIELRERLARGEIAARGKLGHSKESLARATEPIPTDFWVNAFVQPHGEIVIADDDRGAVGTNGGGGPSFRGVILRQRDVESVWPKKSNAEETRLSRFVEPLRAEIEAEQGTDLMIPFVALREIAKAYGVDFSSSDSPAANRATKLEAMLGEAAARGKLIVEGRIYRGIVKDRDPMLPIEPSHFRTYNFAHGNLHYPTANRFSRTETMDMVVRQQDGIKGETYYDLHVAERGARIVLEHFSKLTPMQQQGWSDD